MEVDLILDVKVASGEVRPSGIGVVVGDTVLGFGVECVNPSCRYDG